MVQVIYKLQMTYYSRSTYLYGKFLQYFTNIREMSKQGSKKTGKNQKATVNEVSEQQKSYLTVSGCENQNLMSDRDLITY